jgi:hypothetical protein
MSTVYCVNQYPIKALNFFEASSDHNLSWTRLSFYQPSNLNFPPFLRSMPQPFFSKFRVSEPQAAIVAQMLRRRLTSALCFLKIEESCPRQILPPFKIPIFKVGRFFLHQNSQGLIKTECDKTLKTVPCWTISPLPPPKKNTFFGKKTESLQGFF